MGNMVEYALIMENIIKEIGNFDNIELYSHSNNQFITEEGWEVKVEFLNVPEIVMGSVNLSVDIKQEEAKWILYTVEGEQAQFEKTSLSKLIKILGTVVDIIIQYVKNNSNIKLLTVFAANKNSDNKFMTDPQKSKYYKTIILRQIAKLNQGWHLKDIDIIPEEYSGFLIYKKK